MNTPASPAPFRRRIIVIKRALQMKYVLFVSLSVLFTAAVLTIDVYYVLAKLCIKDLGAERLAAVMAGIFSLLAVHFSIFFLIVLILSVFVSHRFAGPVFRIEKIAESITEGDLTVKAYLRQGDELFETAEKVNRMAASLKEKVGEDRRRAEDAAQKLEQISKNLKEGRITAEKAAVQLEQVRTDVLRITSGFKIS